MTDVGAFDPDDYPGPRPAGPVVVHNRRIWPVAVDGPCDAPVRLTDAARAGGAPDPAQIRVLDEPQQVRWSVAYGSNASPPRLAEKRLDAHGALLLPARLAGFAPAYELRRTGYGSVPVTLVPSDEVMDTWVLGIPAELTGRLDASEGRIAEGPRDVAGAGDAGRGHGPAAADGRRRGAAHSYRLAYVGEVAVADRFRLPDAPAYRPGPATRIQLHPDGAARTWPQTGQSAARDHLDVGGPSQPAPPPDRVIAADWPATPLTDLPLFVYGSLRPGQPAWPAVADDVEVVGEARLAATLYDTGNGWPAVQLPTAAEPAAPGVHGTLLDVRDPADAPGLLRRVDAYEGAPELFVRTTVHVDTDRGPRFAVAYAWAAGRPPGRVLPDGRWPPTGPATR